MKRLSSLLVAVNSLLFASVVAMWPSISAQAERLLATDPDLMPSPSIITFSAVGLVSSATARVIHRTSLNPVGWVLHGIGLGLIGSAAGVEFTTLVGGGLELGAVGRVALTWVGWGWAPGIILIGVFLPLLFPTGRPPSSRWRWVGWLGALTMIFGAAAVAVYAWSNPETYYSGALDVDGPAWGLITAMILISIVGALSSVVVRFRRAGPVERHQLKWVLAALLVVGAALGLSLTPMARGLLNGALQQHLLAALFGLVPLSIGIAITRYRLYEIDRIVSRSLTYALVAGLLAAIYAGSVTALTSILPAQSALAVAASTLVVAMLFSPLRSRLQRLVDRRFNRSKFEADVVLSTLSQRLEESFTTDSIRSVLTHTVSDCLHPRTVGLWLAES